MSWQPEHLSLESCASGRRIDINTDSAKHAVLAQQCDRIQRSQQILLTEAGIIPGCPAAIVRWAAEHSASLLLTGLPLIARLFANDPRLPGGFARALNTYAKRPFT